MLIAWTVYVMASTPGSSGFSSRNFKAADIHQALVSRGRGCKVEKEGQRNSLLAWTATTVRLETLNPILPKF